MTGVVVCVDFGSTFTKALLVDLDDAEVVARAEHPTTIATDVLEGYDACLATLVAADPRATDARVLACSSAGGGLRIAVVGHEELITAEAGRRVALSSGGAVVHVAAGALGPAEVADLDRSRPDLVLLTGGTDGGNDEVLLHNAAALAARPSGPTSPPVVVAGNASAAARVGDILLAAGHRVRICDNVVPQIGRLVPEGARRAIREVFVTHVIGGKQLSSRDDGATFTALVAGATPDVVLTGVEVLATEVGDVVVVDVGGATTDVHSVVDLDPERGARGTPGGLSREVVAPTAATRTVEGDLGMRWSATSTVAALAADPGPTGPTGQAAAPDPVRLGAAAQRRTGDPGFVPTTSNDLDDDEAIARAALVLALRRHAGRARVVVGPDGRVVERTGVDLREVDLVVGSGGVLRHGRDGVTERVLGVALDAPGDGGWQLPERARVAVDGDYVLAAVGLLVEDHPEVARRLARSLLAEPAPKSADPARG